MGARKYFILNKDLDFRKGFYHNLSIGERSFKRQSEDKDAYFISEIYDSGENDTIWHRAAIKTRSNLHQFTVHIYSANYINKDIKNALNNDSHPIAKKKGLFSVYLKKTIHQLKDSLLHEVSGRYVWFILEFWDNSSMETEIESIKLYFPKETWISYLPEVYAENKESADFLERFLSIFQTIYEELEDKIEKLPMNLLPMVCDSSFISYVSELLSEEISIIWEEEKLRILLSDAMSFYGYRATVKALAKRIELFTGERPFIAEYHKFEEERKGNRKNLVNTLYGDDPFVFTVIVKEECVSTNEVYNKLLRIIEDIAPAHMEHRLVVIRSFIFLDSYSYLGINSVLSAYKNFDLGKTITIPYSVITS